MKCIECEDAKARHPDPRQPPHGEGDCLCFTCWESAAADREDDLREELSEIAALRRRYVEARLGALQKIVSVRFSEYGNTGCVGRGRIAWLLLGCGHRQERKASDVPNAPFGRVRCRECLRRVT